MERLVSGLVDDYESGRMTRRQLVQVLAAVAAAGSGALPAAAARGGFKATGVDHISYIVNDYRRARDFYVSLLGMSIVAEDPAREVCALRFGESSLVIRGGAQKAAAARPLVDHFSLFIEDWNTERVRAELERRGLKPRLDTGPAATYASFHVADPEGYDLQIAGTVGPGDTLYKG